MTQDPAISAEYLATTPLPSTTWGPVDIHAPGAVAELHRRIAETQEALRVRVELLLSLNVGRDDSLLDAEGYPRSDICVHTVRLARSQADMLHNDLHQLTHQAQQAVEAAFSRPAEERGDLAGWSSTAGSTPGSTAGAQRPSSSSPAGGSASNVGQRLSAPVGGLPATAPTDVLDGAFATVNVVIPHSPAHEAGLREGDVLYRWQAEDQLPAFSSSEDREHNYHTFGRVVMSTATHAHSMSLGIFRPSTQSTLELVLRPRRTGTSPGVLGCMLVKIEE
ncbi:hypothetical protein H696_05151 [Fonticula alba]|uniref:Nas2 N-terminal domain-containing protein n=1 Tax=Fonticula alba TaxID=691883 RepID=A0A058Z258_FONAL|nr:hypothetical protein H696_05151 [Fonticula alba]KCV68226.1 hypothetical protein H696_05151 [Fonticula alba]|eukprot:XP_009497280.1 hypothetical protein H696_05151 [Fonticula alba]